MSPLLEALAVAVGLGLLVGLQREWEGRHRHGIRTFPIVAALGCLCGFVAEDHGGPVLAAGLVALGVLLATDHARRAGDENPPGGLTTEVAALATFGIGAVLAGGHLEVGVAAGGVLAVLLHWKKPLHGFAGHAGQEDIRAIFRWALIALVVLPLLPDETYGPYDTINPFEIWLMVVLIVGISVVSYLVSKFIGAKKGAVVAGILGGLISSTATTVSIARRAQHSSLAPAIGTFVVLVASAIGFVRVVIEVAVVAPGALGEIVAPYAVFTGWLALIVAVSWWTARDSDPLAPEAEDPSELGTALTFGALYAVVLVIVAAAEANLDDRGLYLLAAISGLTDVDAITLSSAKMIREERIEVDVGWRMILIGALANNAFKAGIVAVLGPPRIARWVGVGFGTALIGGGLLLWLWP